MKKYIIGGALVFSLFFATNVKAATIDDQIALQTQYHTALVELITYLQAQVLDLMNQLKTIQDAQTVTNTQVQQIVQNTTPIVVETPVQSFGAVTPSVTKSIKILIGRNLTTDNSKVNYFDIHAFYTENGNPTNTSITLSSSDGILSNTNSQQTRSMGVPGLSGFGVYATLSDTQNAVITAQTADGFIATSTTNN